MRRTLQATPRLNFLRKRIEKLHKAQWDAYIKELSKLTKQGEVQLKAYFFPFSKPPASIRSPGALATFLVLRLLIAAETLRKMPTWEQYCQNLTAKLKDDPTLREKMCRDCRFPKDRSYNYFNLFPRSCPEGELALQILSWAHRNKVIQFEFGEHAYPKWIKKLFSLPYVYMPTKLQEYDIYIQGSWTVSSSVHGFFDRQ